MFDNSVICRAYVIRLDASLISQLGPYKATVRILACPAGSPRSIKQNKVMTLPVNTLNGFCMEESIAEYIGTEIYITLRRSSSHGHIIVGWISINAKSKNPAISQ